MTGQRSENRTRKTRRKFKNGKVENGTGMLITEELGTIVFCLWWHLNRTLCCTQLTYAFLERLWPMMSPLSNENAPNVNVLLSNRHNLLCLARSDMLTSSLQQWLKLSFHIGKYTLAKHGESSNVLCKFLAHK